MAFAAIAILVMAAASHSFAQTPRQITLEEAVELSLKNSKQMKFSQ